MSEEPTAAAMEFAESLFLPASRDANEPHETKVKRIASRVQSLLNQRDDKLEALQKANSYMADQLQQSAYVSKDNLALRTQNQELREASVSQHNELNYIRNQSRYLRTALEEIAVMELSVRAAKALALKP